MMSRGKVLAIICGSLLVGLGWLYEIGRANVIAQRDFGPTPCWFVQKASPDDPPGLVAGPRGFYMPNPMRQINRKFLLIGGDPGVAAPHFAVAARDADGTPGLWGWSYRERAFWSLRAAGRDQQSAFYDTSDPDTLLAACPDLPNAKPQGGAL